MSPIHQALSLTICADADEATAKGFVYRAPETKPIRIETVVVVRNGTQAGRSTVDFVLKDETGQQFVFSLTGALLKTIPC